MIGGNLLFLFVVICLFSSLVTLTDKAPPIEGIGGKFVRYKPHDGEPSSVGNPIQRRRAIVKRKLRKSKVLC